MATYYYGEESSDEEPPPPLSPFMKSETLHGLEASQRLLEEKLEHLKLRLAEEGATV